MSRNKQLAINMFYQVVGFIISMGITFVLTPFIIKSLGLEAYGFIGLSNNIIGYLQLATVALNSMAGRFVTIAYHKGNIEDANRYFTSVFYSNCIFAFLILLASAILFIYLEKFITIPSYLVLDVKVLFLLMTFNAAGTIVFNLYSISTFIKNRLDISNIRQFVSTLLNAIVLYISFAFFKSHLWYIGIASLISFLYLTIVNICICKKLTPELCVKSSFFDLSKIKELLSSGVWNLTSKLSDILQRGLDLLFANWWINASAMSVLSITTNVPFIILSFFSLLSSTFAPSMTADFAKGDISSIKNDLSKSIRILSVCMLLPLSILYVYGDVFYSLWVPSENSQLLQWLTISGTIALLFTSPLECFWNVFTITNKIKGSSIFMFINSLAVFFTVIFALQLSDNITIKMFIIAGTRSIWGVLRGIIFLPIYSAYCLNMKWNAFYPLIIKPILGLFATLCLAFCFRIIYIPTSWIGFFAVSVFVSLAALTIAFFVILSKSDRVYLYAKVKEIL